MKRENKLQNIVIILLCVTVLTMSIGFAVSAYNQDLDITGNVTATAASWDVHFDDTTYAEQTGTGYVTSTTHSVSGTTANFTVSLNPGEKFGFEVTAKNYGTLAAYLSSVTLTSLTSTESKYLSYTVKVDGTVYSANTTNLNVTLPTAGHKVEVEVSYNLPASASDLPTTDTTKSLSISLNYASVLEQ